MKHVFILWQYLMYRWKARSAHGIHSPFVFDFVVSVLQDRREFYPFEQIAQLRDRLLSDSQVLHVEDFGAGSLLQVGHKRMVKEIARNAGRTPKYGKLLFRIVDHYRYEQILELGTSLGIGTSYIATACKNAHVTTIEGSKEIAQKAKSNFDSITLQNVHQIIGNFDEILPDVLNELQALDLVFIDGNHRKDATLRYFEQLLPFVNENSVLIFDDIHWSKGMHEAWLSISNDPRVALSIDVFQFGLIFFLTSMKEKQHFVLKY